LRISDTATGSVELDTHDDDSATLDTASAIGGASASSSPASVLSTNEYDLRCVFFEIQDLRGFDFVVAAVAAAVAVVAVAVVAALAAVVIVGMAVVLVVIIVAGDVAAAFVLLIIISNPLPSLLSSDSYSSSSQFCCRVIRDINLIHSASASISCVIVRDVFNKPKETLQFILFFVLL
jgi:hypothetical protein